MSSKEERIEIVLEGGKPWGFRLQGGSEFRAPLQIAKVTPGGKAAAQGVLEHDYLVAINGTPCANGTHNEALRLLKLSGWTMTLTIQRGQAPLRPPESPTKTPSPSHTSYTSSVPKVVAKRSASFAAGTTAGISAARQPLSTSDGVAASPINKTPHQATVPPPSARASSTSVTAISEPSFSRERALSNPPAPPAGLTKAAGGDEQPASSSSDQQDGVTGPISPRKFQKPAPPGRGAKRLTRTGSDTTSPREENPPDIPTEGGQSKDKGWYKLMFRNMHTTGDPHFTPSQVKLQRSSTLDSSSKGPPPAVAPKPSRRRATSFREPGYRERTTSDPTSHSNQYRVRYAKDDTTVTQQPLSKEKEQLNSPTMSTREIVASRPGKPESSGAAHSAVAAPAMSPKPSLQARSLNTSSSPQLSPAAKTTSSPQSTAPPDSSPQPAPVSTPQQSVGEQVQTSISTTDVMGQELPVEVQPIDKPKLEKLQQNTLPATQESVAEQVETDKVVEDVTSNESVNKQEDLQPVAGEESCSALSTNEEAALQEQSVESSSSAGQEAGERADVYEEQNLSVQLKETRSTVVHDNSQSDSADRQTVEDSHVDGGKEHPSGVQPSLSPVDQLLSQVAPGEGLAAALYSYDAQSADELSFMKGNEITIVQKVNNDWLEGTINGQKGILPASYVKIIVPLSDSAEHHENTVEETPSDIARSDVQKVERAAKAQTPAAGVSATAAQEKVESKSSDSDQPVKPCAIARFPFPAENDWELRLRKGDLVTLIRKVDDNWYEGKVAGKKGLFPASYVEVLRDVDEGTADSGESKGSSASNAQDQSKEQRSAGAAGISLKAKGERHMAVYSYEAQNNDELALEEGDIVMVTEQWDDGWFVGTSVRTGQYGTFPGNYVEVA